MPVVTVLDSFLKTIILVENYRLRFKISGSGPDRHPGYTIAHTVQKVGSILDRYAVLTGRNAGPRNSIHGKTMPHLRTAVWLCTLLYYVLCCCVLLCWCSVCAVLMCISMCFYWFVSVILVIFLVSRRMRPNFLDFSDPPFS